MIAYIDVGLAELKLFAAADIVADKRKHAKDPAPDMQEKIAYRTQPEKKGQR